MSMNNNLKVQWYTGMLLFPQHFQQLERTNVHSLLQIVEHLNPHYYGIFEMQLDTSNENIIRVNTLKAIMQDLTLIEYEATLSADEAGSVENEDDLSINITELLSKATDGLYYVYLILPNDGSATEPRYLPVKSKALPDTYNPDIREHIIQLEPNIKLFFGSTPPLQALSIPLVCLKVVNKQYTITSFQPPMIAWTKDNPILTMLEDLVQQIRDKIIYLQLNQATENAYSINARLSFLQGLAPLEASVNSQEHPYSIYKCFLHLVASIANLEKSSLPKFVYSHEDIAGTFIGMINWTKNILDSLAQKYRKQTVMRIDNEFRISIKDANIVTYEDKKVIILAGNNTNKGRQAFESWVDSCMIASNSMLKQLKQNRSRGARRHAVEFIPDLQIKSSENYIFFLIYVDENFIKLSDDYISLYNDELNIIPDILESYI